MLVVSRLCVCMPSDCDSRFRKLRERSMAAASRTVLMDSWETTSHPRKVVFATAIDERPASACERGRCHEDATPKKIPQKNETRTVTRIMRTFRWTVLRKG